MPQRWCDVLPVMHGKTHALFVRLVALIGVSMVAFAYAPSAHSNPRDEEIGQCLPGEIMSWGDGRDQPAVSANMVFVYDHAAAPPWFEQGLVLSAVQKAASQWSRCGVASQVLERSAASGVGRDVVSVRWSDADSAGNFGLANFTRRTLVLGPAAFLLLRTRNPAHDARETLEMVISDEMGHLFGLMSHSRRCVDVTSSYDNGKGEACYARDRTQLRHFVEYRATLPTACDIARCRIANGLENAHPLANPLR